MTARPLDLWRRFKQHLCECPTIGLRLDISRMDFDDGFFAQMSEPVARAYEAMAALEAGRIDLGIVPIGEPDLGAAFEFLEILPGRNIVACRTGHPLLRKRPLEAQDLTRYPWVGPLPGSPLMSDLQMILMSIGMTDLHIRYSGGSLMSVVNVLVETDALAVLPFSVVFAQRGENRITVLPYNIPQPNRSLGILMHRAAARAPVVERFSGHITTAFENLKHVIQRHERAVVWGNSPASEDGF